MTRHAQKRNFRSCSISEFFNSIRKERTFADGLRMVWNEPQRAQDIACTAIVLEK